MRTEHRPGPDCRNTYYVHTCDRCGRESEPDGRHFSAGPDDWKAFERRTCYGGTSCADRASGLFCPECAALIDAAIADAVIFQTLRRQTPAEAAQTANGTRTDHRADRQAEGPQNAR